MDRAILNINLNYTKCKTKLLFFSPPISTTPHHTPANPKHQKQTPNQNHRWETPPNPNNDNYITTFNTATCHTLYNLLH